MVKIVEYLLYTRDRLFVDVHLRQRTSANVSAVNATRVFPAIRPKACYFSREDKKRLRPLDGVAILFVNQQSFSPRPNAGLSSGIKHIQLSS